MLRYTLQHPANRGKRIAALRRAVWFQIRVRFTGRPVTARLGAHSTIHVHLHSNAASKVIYANPPDWAEMRFWQRHIEPGDLFVDVGSNVGTYAIWAADCGARVIAIEPDPTSVQRLRENVSLNSHDIEILPIALGSAPGLANLSVGKDTMNHLTSSKPQEVAQGQVVRVSTLDEVLKDKIVRGCKIDVEGYERHVLAGGRKILSERRIDILQIEWNAMSLETLGETREPMLRELEELGYLIAHSDVSGEVLSMGLPTSDTVDLFAVSPRVASQVIAR